MGYKLVIFMTVLSLLAAFVMEALIKVHFFDRVYDHFPGNCTMFPMNGSEDFALFPNDHVMVSSGLEVFNNAEKPPAGVYMVDLQNPTPHPVKLSFEGEFLSKVSPDFNPHGLGSWVTEEGDYLLYVVNHRVGFDAIECFIYHPNTKSLEHRKTISNSEMYNLNDVVLVEKDLFYTTRDHYFKNPTAKIFEVFLRLSYGTILHVDARGGSVHVKIAADRLAYGNGISKSNNGKFVYINECAAGTVTALTIKKDNTLERRQSILLEIGPDNTFVSPINGHLWVGIIAKPLEFYTYRKHSDPTSTPCGGRVLHVTVNEGAEFPFDDSQVEEVFSTSGKMISATSAGLYHNKKLLVGSIRTGMMVCDAPYVMY